MGTKQSLGAVRRTGGRIGVAAALISVTGLSIFAQQQREWRDYAGGPDSSRFVAATQITKSNVSQLQVAWTYPAARPTSIRSSSAASSTAAARTARSWRSMPRPESRSGSTRASEGFNVRGDELLGEQGRQGPPADLQHRQHAPGARRADRRDDHLVRQGRPGRSARRPRSRSGDDQPAERARPDECSRTS